MQSLFFTIGSVRTSLLLSIVSDSDRFYALQQTVELVPNAQIWPRNLNSVIGGQEGKIYLIAADLGSSVGTGLDFISMFPIVVKFILPLNMPLDGFTFLQRVYTVYDTTNKQVGVAETESTSAEIN